MLYRLKNNGSAARRSLDAAAAEAALQDIADRVEGSLTVELPTESDLPNPRVVDLLDANIRYERRMKAFAESNDARPTPAYRLEWLIGLVDLSDEGEFVYIDFRHPKLKAVFGGVYRSRHEWDLSPARTRDAFEVFVDRCAEVRRQLDTGELSCACVKVVAGEDVPLQVRRIP